MMKGILKELIKAEGLERAMEMAEAAGMIGMLTAEEIEEAAREAVE